MKHFSVGVKVMERPSWCGLWEDYTHLVSFKETLKCCISSCNSLRAGYSSTKWFTLPYLAVSFKLLSSGSSISGRKGRLFVLPSSLQIRMCQALQAMALQKQPFTWVTSHKNTSCHCFLHSTSFPSPFKGHYFLGPLVMQHTCCVSCLFP